MCAKRNASDFVHASKSSFDFQIECDAYNVYDSFVQANQSIDKAKTKMDEAKLRLQDGPGSLTKKVQKMKKLGRLSTKKELPDDLEDDIN